MATLVSYLSEGEKPFFNIVKQKQNFSYNKIMRFCLPEFYIEVKKKINFVPYVCTKATCLLHFLRKKKLNSDIIQYHFF